MKESNLEHKLWIFCNKNFKHKMKRLQIPQKPVYQKFYVH